MSLRQKIKIFFSVVALTIPLVFSAPSHAVDGSFLSDAACPDSKYFSGLINKFCWSCVLPINLMGFLSDPPDGGYDGAFCHCSDELGVPKFGFHVGYWSPDKIIEITTTPWCSPTLGGTMLQNNLTMMGAQGMGQEANDTTMATFHYNYFDNPMFKMLSMFLVPDCDKDPGIIDLDMAYMSIIDITWYQDMLAFIFNADATAFANPIAQAACVADCVYITATSDPSDLNWFCAGCDGMMFPFTGNIYTDENAIRSSSLVVTRALASLHRRGLARQTYGKKAMCETVFSPMIPKPMYKVSMAFPRPEVDGFGSSVSVPSLNDTGQQQKDESGNPLMHSINQKCCHPLGDNWMKWGLGRMTPGGGKDNTFVYNVFRYNDCCIFY
ncbi:conjugal transfer protein TraU [Photobacterium damselae subsp. damselae]|uniref:Conjugal transfer protein TraU n=2 Tax=Photobacterium damselae subsp. damselae TaxID=85581 RepID=A0AAD3ZWG9_PHODD|nr:TraU family protein [Photobacterium damselae]KAB1184334.1 conjugal transfer protein TraU [Photobacterium damselae subsp. damselae]NVO60214.1 TraU family protein [Photobacterium damselae subsp. damselae]PSB89260.1 conjugal transfer protein TraU [Photobacterium damselae subsp. damselae]